MREHYLDFEKPLQEVEKNIADLKKAAHPEKGIDFSKQIEELEKQRNYILETLYQNLTPWQVVKVARHPQRPVFLDYAGLIFDEFLEFHGDRQFRDDAAIVSGFAKMNGETYMVIGEEKGKTTKEKVKRNFGSPYPEGYRKALRAMKLAEKFNKPILTFVDTQGAFCGMDSEERGQGEAIAKNLFEMSAVKVPIISTVIGEGGSGGALAIAVADKVFMMENSVYSVISPEGCASILWKDASKAEKAAKALKMTSKDLLGFEIIEGIIPEPHGGAHRDPVAAAEAMKAKLDSEMKELRKISPAKLVEKRYDRYRKLGRFTKI